MNGKHFENSTLRINVFLDLAVQQHASDIHLVAGQPPVYRIQGVLTRAALPILEADPLADMLFEMLTDRQKDILKKNNELDFSYSASKDYYFRINLFVERSNVGASIRLMPGLTTSLAELGLPQVVRDLTLRRSGLILIVGRAGMGKTTTLNHMVDSINQERSAKVITIEDPVEFVHESRKSLIVQREVGLDTMSFEAGLKYALRQDPDVVVIGEMRDLESVAMALTTAETGHLVMGTLHAPDAIEAINRIIDVYPGDKQNQIRVQLAENLMAVIGQQLLPGKKGGARVLGTEVMLTTLAIRNMIRRNSLNEIRSQMETGREGMYTIEQCLSDLVKRDLITPETAQSHAKYPQLLDF